MRCHRPRLVLTEGFEPSTFPLRGDCTSTVLRQQFGEPGWSRTTCYSIKSRAVTPVFALSSWSNRMVRATGFEPACQRRPGLSGLRLPISPHPQTGSPGESRTRHHKTRNLSCIRYTSGLKWRSAGESNPRAISLEGSCRTSWRTVYTSIGGRRMLARPGARLPRFYPDLGV